MNELSSAASRPTKLPREFSFLSGATLAANAAEQIALVAVPLVAVLVLKAGPKEVGLISAAQTLPFLVAAIPIGLLVDRFPRRNVLFAGELLRLVAFVILLIALLSGNVSVGLLALIGGIGTLGTVAFIVASPVMVASLVPREALPRANSRMELARSLAFAAGPAASGALVAALGADAAFIVATVLCIAALAALFYLPNDTPMSADTPAPVERRHPIDELREGARFVMKSELLRPMILAGLVWNVAWFVLQAVYVPHAIANLGLTARGVGFVLAVGGIGMVIGSAIAPAILRRVSFGKAIAIGPVMSLIAAALMAATIFVPHPGLAFVAYFCFGSGPVVWTVVATTLRQAIVPQAMLGRVGSMFLTANAGARPLGALLAALIATAVGEASAITACLVVMAIGFCLQAAIICWSAAGRLGVVAENGFQSTLSHR